MANATKVKALVLRTAGTNCEDESVRALQRAGADAELARTDAAARDADRLGAYGILVFAGGFSYGDDLGSGRVWGHELRTGGLGAALRRHVDRGGVILGVCNGFQVLVESGLFEPDKAPEERSIALYANASNHYECRWVTLREHAGKCAWLTEGLEWPCPVAHGEGRFVVRDERVLEQLRANGQIALTYVAKGAEGKGGVQAPGDKRSKEAFPDLEVRCWRSRRPISRQMSCRSTTRCSRACFLWLPARAWSSGLGRARHAGTLQPEAAPPRTSSLGCAKEMPRSRRQPTRADVKTA